MQQHRPDLQIHVTLRQNAQVCIRLKGWKGEGIMSDTSIATHASARYDRQAELQYKMLRTACKLGVTSRHARQTSGKLREAMWDYVVTLKYKPIILDFLLQSLQKVHVCQIKLS